MTINDLINSDGTLSNKVGPILRDNKNELWVKEIYNTPGKTVTQKVYNVLHGINSIPKNSKGQNLKFLSITEGYKGDESKVEIQADSVESNTLQDQASEVEDGKPLTVSREEDFEKNEIDSSIITTLGGNASETDLLKEHGLDVSKWKILKVRHSIWQNFSKKAGIKNLYASKIVAVPRTFLELNQEQLLKKINQFVGYKPKTCEPISNKLNDYTLLVPIADFHFGLLANAKSLASNKYDMNIAEKRMETFISTLLAQINNLKNKKQIKRVIITLGNDFFNADNLVGTTTKGTPQDQETNYYDIFDRGVLVAIKLIESIKTSFDSIVDLDIYGVQSNHDKVTSYALMQCLYNRYRGSLRVNVHCDSIQTPRFYLKAGNNLLGFGHETKITDCPKLMSNEAADLWSETTYRTFFIAHLHHEECQEFGSVVVRRLPILSGVSNWTNEMGFVGNTPRAQAFIFDNAKGLKDIVNCNI